MKKISFILLSLGLFSSVFTQEATTPKGPWEKGIISTATFSQTTLSNWAAGGQNAISMNLYGKLFANYKKDKNSWENSLELAYGLLRQDKSAPVKSDDKIDFITKYSRQLNNDKLFFSTFINFRSQLANGFAYPEAGGTDLISQFAAPAYLFITVGLEYKPVDFFSIYFSPLTNKNTWVTAHDNIDETSYGLDAGSTWRFEGCSYLKLHFKKELFKNVNVESKADFFANYAE
ncbi:MAG: DUF3078 domain-containing protein, partial [Cyclobacteriaceae bacterium]